MFHRPHINRVLASACLMAALQAPVAARAGEEIVVLLDQAKVLQLPAGAATVIVGNPIIADVTMLKKTNQVVLTGKGYGQTNMIALDAKGAAVGESSVRVAAPSNGLIVQRGMERETWECSPRCHPTVRLGDAQKFMSEAAGQIGARNAAASTAR
jgi:Flp pilus assembly secretin CpaC